MHTINDREGHYKEIVLYPDFASSGIWCSCGLSIADPSDTLSIPYRLVELVDFWNHYWELCVDNYKGLVIDNVQKSFNNVGRSLADEISEYLPCNFYQDRSIIKDFHKMEGMSDE